jgi:nitrate reductase beta subunit
MDEPEVREMYRQLAIGDYDERYVIPRAHPEVGVDPFGMQGSCGIDFAAAAPKDVGTPLPMVVKHDPRGEQA